MPFVAENVKSSPSTSLADKSTVSELSSSIAWSAINTITGASLIEFIVTWNVSLTESLFTTSLAVTVISPLPWVSALKVIYNTDSLISTDSASIDSEAL